MNRADEVRELRGAHAATRRRARARVAWALLLGGLSPAAGLSLPLLTTDVGAGARGPVTQDVSSLSQSSPGPLPLSDSRVAVATDTGAMQANSFARAFADYGVLRAEAISVVTGSGAGGEAASQGTASFSDELTFGGAPVGTLGSATVSIYVDGTATAEASSTGLGSGEASIELVAEDAIANQVSIRLLASTSGGILDQTLSLNVTFVFGQPFDFSAQLSASALAFSQGTAPGAFDTLAGVSDFWSTARWSGISDVRDAGGNALASFTLDSASGTDYSRAFAVPEPALAWLLAAAVAVARARRSRGARR